MGNPDHEVAGECQRKRHRRMRHIAAVTFGLFVVIGAELTCRLAGWGSPQLQEDPFVGFSGRRPLFVLSEEGRRFVTSPAREAYFARESFAAEKGGRTRRIFCLGGSTVQGRPWSIETSFTTWLELVLNQIDDVHDWEVINCGGISYASYRLVPILEECLQYEPDAIILCTGHNEFLEDRSYSKVLRSPLVQRSSQLRLFNLAHRVISHWTPNHRLPAGRRTELTEETEPILNYDGGLAAYHRDDSWRAGIIEHYEFNLRRMVERVQTAGLPMLLINPASNLRDCPPFKWELPADFSTSQMEIWQQLLEQAGAMRLEHPGEALALLQRGRDMDRENPLTYYQLGRTLVDLRDTSAARESFLSARDYDVCPLRMISPLQERLARVSEDLHVPLLDLHELLEQRSQDGILGDEWLVDHVHPSIAGHQLLAVALLEPLGESGLITHQEADPAEFRAVFDAHLAGLESAYFLRGQQMLEGLRAWSQGRADGPAASDRFPHRIPAEK